MGRKSKLSDSQWEDITRRHVAGEAIRSLAREYGLAENAIRKRISAQATEIKTVAHQVVAADKRLSSLPIGAQVIAHSLIDDLKAMSTHLVSAGKYSAMTSHRLAMIANVQVDKIDDAAPLENIDALKSVAIIQKAANEAAVIPSAFLNGKNETAVKLGNDDDEDTAMGAIHLIRARKKAREKGSA